MAQVPVGLEGLIYSMQSAHRMVTVRNMLNLPRNFTGSVQAGPELDNKKFWFRHGLFHRPYCRAAVEADGMFDCEYFRRGRFHNTRGPAVIVDGHHFYFLYGFLFSFEGWLFQIQLDLGITHAMHMKLLWG